MPKYSHLTDTAQLKREWIEKEVFPLSDELRKISGSSRDLAGRALYCLFYEPSFLTRTSFERAIGLLGGQAYHTEDASQFFPVTTANFIDNVIDLLASLHVDVVVVRSSDAGVIERAEATDAMPVINGGSMDDHPTQALAEYFPVVISCHRRTDSLKPLDVTAHLPYLSDLSVPADRAILVYMPSDKM